MIEIAVQAMLWVSGIFAVLGAVGLFRFPDFYTRSHAATMVSVGGVCLALLALLISSWWSIFSVKIAVVLALNLITGPTGTHAIASAAYDLGIKPRVLKDELKAGRGEK